MDADVRKELDTLLDYVTYVDARTTAIQMELSVILRHNPEQKEAFQVELEKNVKVAYKAMIALAWQKDSEVAARVFGESSRPKISE